jgi:hypothetical protein
MYFNNPNNPTYTDSYKFENTNEMTEFAKKLSRNPSVKKIENVALNTISVDFMTDELRKETNKIYEGETVMSYSDKGGVTDSDVKKARSKKSRDVGHGAIDSTKTGRREIAKQANARKQKAHDNQKIKDRKKKELAHKRDQLTKEREKI